MAGPALLIPLDQSEIDQVPEEIRTKIQTFIATKLEDFDGLKIKYEKIRVNSEQQCFDFEKQLISCRGKLETETSQRANLQEKLSELKSKHDEATEELEKLQESQKASKTSEDEYNRQIQILEGDKRDLHLQSNKKSKDIDRLNEEVNQLQSKVTTANNDKCEAQARLGEQQSDQISREFREKRLQKEKEQLENQVEWFNKQLTEKTNQLSSVRKEKILWIFMGRLDDCMDLLQVRRQFYTQDNMKDLFSQTNNLLEVQAQLDDKTKEVEHLQALVDSLKTRAEEQAKRTDSLVEKLKDERESQLQLEEQFRQELGVKQRLIDLYKASTEENDTKVTELTGAVEELRRLLKDASTTYTELENSKAEEISRLESLLTEKSGAVSRLEEELRNANDLMTALKKGAVTLTDQAVESLSPSAAATSKLLKSGMSLTQIYNEYVQATDALGEERQENRRLNSYLEQILQEIEEKAPLLKRQREDYETSLSNLNQMTSQLDTTMLECEKLRADADDMRRRYGHIQRECDKYQQTSVDLGKQVQHLLKEIEELRGGRVVRDDLRNTSSNNVSSSSDMISEKLVTFRTIEDLQQQNQRLIQVARDLSEKKEQEEREATAEKTRELKEQLDFAMTELEHLKEARSRQAEMVESIVRQRDMYRVLLLQEGQSAEVPQVTPVTSTPMHPSPRRVVIPSSPVDKKELEQARAALVELRSEFEAYKKDKAENDKVQSDMLEKMRQNVSELRVANTKLSTQLESATERYKIVQNNAAGFKKEADLLQERNQQASATNLKQETAIANLKEDLMASKENVARWQVQIENLQREKNLLSNSEQRHAMELESIRREQTSQTMLMSSLQAIQNNQERAEFEMRTRYENQIDALQRESANLRRRLEDSLEEKTRQATQWEDIVKNIQLEMNQKKDKQVALQTRADNAVLELETVKQELSTCEAKLAAAEIKIENMSATRDEESTTNVVETEAVKDLKNQLAENQVLIKNLRLQIEASKKHANQYKVIAEDVENNLKNQAKSMKEIQEACEKKIRDNNAARDVLANRLELMEKDLQASLDENQRLSNEAKSLHVDLRKQLTSLQTELEEAVTQKNLAVSNCEAAQQDCREQAGIAAEAQDKYQRELMLHAADVEGHTAIKKQLEDLKEHVQQSEEETVIYEKQLQDAKTSWQEQERVYKQETEMLERRCDDLTKQNALLHEQMAKLSTQVINIQRSSNDDSGANTSFSDDSGKTSDQLVEVIRFLRREKGIAETQLEAVQSECKRVTQKFALKEKQEAEASRALAEERQRAQVSAETAAHQVELMRKVSNMNVLTDSNKLLRDERDHLLVSKQQLDAKIRQLESDIEPLQSRLREVQTQKDSLTVERDSLQEDVNRWKNRTSSLIEQSHKTDPEEHKRLQLEKENMRKLLAQAREENSKQKAEITKINASMTSLQTEINNLKQEVTKTGQEKENMRKLLAHAREENTKHKAEITKINISNTTMQTELNTLRQESARTGQEATTLRRQVDDKTKECEEKGMTITRLKQIGRKYKEQAEKVSKELEDTKARAAAQETDNASTATSLQTIADLRTTVTSLENRLTESQNEVQAAVKKAEEATAELNTAKESLNTTTQELTQAKERNTTLQGEVDTFEERAAEFERKQTQSRTVLQNARNKMMTQKTQMEKLETENKRMEVENKKLEDEIKNLLKARDDPDHIKTLQAQHESQISGLEKQLDEAMKSAATETERLQTENTELQNKIQQLQKQLDSVQHKHSPPQQPISARHGGSGAPSSTSTEAPKTANIKPMAPSTSTSRQAPPMTAHSSAAKATASIRPMAMSPTTANLPPSGTPTATVMPTTLTQHDVATPIPDDNLPGPSGLQQTSLAGSSRVQIVEPHVVGEWNQDVTSSEGQGSEEASTSMADTVQVVNPTHSSQPTASTSSEGQQQQPHTLGVALGKRTREDESSFPEDSDTKRSRLGSQEQHAIPTITVMDENQQVITQIQPQLSSVSTTSHSGQAKTGIATPSTATAIKVAPSTSSVTSSSDTREAQGSQERQSQEVTQSETERGQRGDDVIMVLSDEDDQEEADNAEEDDEDEYEEDDDEDDDDDDEDDEEIEEGDDNDDVVIIDIDEQQQQQQQQQQQHQQSQPSARPQQPFLGHSERLPSTGRSQQLAPFLLGGPGNIFEEEDCTVPSTPTLSQPRRADGFAEALNSPAVAQRFVFGNVGDGTNNPDLAQLESQRALGMDDTRMDLSQFDESSGRSAPTTPTPLTSSAAPESSEPVSEETVTMDPSELYGGESSRSQEQEVMEEEDEALLEGNGDPDEHVEEDREQDNQGAVEGTSRTEGTKESIDGKPDTSGKPPIKKIIWDSPQASSSAPALVSQGGAGPSTGAQQQQQQAPSPPRQQRGALRRAQGQRRGGPTRGRGQFWGSTPGQTRGGQFPPRGRSSRGGYGF